MLRWLWRLVLLALLGRRHGQPPGTGGPEDAGRVEVGAGVDIGELPVEAIEEARPLDRRLPRQRLRAELVVAAALLGAGVAGASFVVAFLLGHDTQLLGVCIGLAFMLLAVASIVA